MWTGFIDFSTNKCLEVLKNMRFSGLEVQDDFLENLAMQPDRSETDGDGYRNSIILFCVKKPLLHIFSLCLSVQMEDSIFVLYIYSCVFFN